MYIWKCTSSPKIMDKNTFKPITIITTKVNMRQDTKIHSHHSQTRQFQSTNQHDQSQHGWIPEFIKTHSYLCRRNLLPFVQRNTHWKSHNLTSYRSGQKVRICMITSKIRKSTITVKPNASN